MDTSKALVQSDHLLRMRRRVIALLSIPGFYDSQFMSLLKTELANVYGYLKRGQSSP